MLFTYNFSVHFQFDMLELDRFDKPLVSCPLLLDAASYLPDTEDLTLDASARDYWLQCFEDAMDKVNNNSSWWFFFFSVDNFIDLFYS